MISIISETERGGGGMIVTDLTTIYPAKAHAHDGLLFDVGVMDFNKYGGDLTFRITRAARQDAGSDGEVRLCFL